MRYTILKYVIAISIFFTSVATVFAQNKKQEVSVYVSGGLSTLSYDTQMGKNNNKAGGSFGIGYTYFLTENIGLNTGLEFTLYGAEYKHDMFGNVAYNMVDPSDQELYDYHTVINNYKEEQKATYINIPLMLQFQHGEKNKWYIAAGAKLGIPVKGKYKSSASELTNKGYFHDTGNWAESQEFMGFGTFDNYSVDKEFDLNVACILSAELGMKWRLKDNMALYTGGYIDYGVNDIVKGSRDRNLIEIEESSEGFAPINNSMLHSSIGYNSNTLTQKLTEKVVPLSVGLKIRLALAL